MQFTVPRELDKLCSNIISTDRNYRLGVHCFSDYRESVEIGARAAPDILEKRKLMSGSKPSMTVQLFGGNEVVI